MSGLCAYKDIFGKPNEGVHSPRIFGLAAVDTGLTILGSYMIAKHFDKKMCNNIYISFVIVFIILMILSVFAHKLFCVETALVKKLNECK